VPQSALLNRPPLSAAAYRRNVTIAVFTMLFFSAALIGPGIYIIVMQQTGERASVKIDDCEVSGSGRYERTDCTGTWIVGGSLLEGGHVVVGEIDGAEASDAGKIVDVTLHGDRAYMRSLGLPSLLIGLGLIPFALLALPRRKPSG
jgi:hypothetical protein